MFWVQVYLVQFMLIYLLYLLLYMFFMLMQFQMFVYLGVFKLFLQFLFFVLQQSFGFGNMQYLYGLYEYFFWQWCICCLISLVLNLLVISWELVVLVLLVLMGMLSNFILFEGEIDNSVVEIMVFVLRYNLFGYFSVFNLFMLFQELLFQNFMIVVFNSSFDILVQVIDFEFYGFFMVYFVDMSFEDMGFGYMDFVIGYDFWEQLYIVGDGLNKEIFVVFDILFVVLVDNWDDFFNFFEFEDVGIVF